MCNRLGMITTVQGIEIKIKSFALEWWNFIRVPRNLINVVVSLFFLYLAYKATKVAGVIATKNAPVMGLKDLVLSNIPRYDTSFIHGPVSFFLYDMRWWLFLLFIRYTPLQQRLLQRLFFSGQSL